jgi:hypothetical protein
MQERVSVTWKRGDFTGIFGLEFRSELWQFRMRKTGVAVMDAVKGLVEQGERHESAEWPL